MRNKNNNLKGYLTEQPKGRCFWLFSVIHCKNFFRSIQAARGFTLIELLVVVSIIGLLASVIMVSLNNTRKEARDKVRRQSLLQFQKALEIYFSDNGRYPTTPLNADGTIMWWHTDYHWQGADYHPTDYVPGLVPKYIAKLPSDPLGGDSDLQFCGGTARAYWYASDGKDYKLLLRCAPEKDMDPKNPLNDPVLDGGPIPYTAGTSGLTPENDPASPNNPTSCDDPPKHSDYTGLNETSPDGTGDYAGGDGKYVTGWSIYSSPRSRCW